MKKLFLLAVLGVFAVGCSSSQKKSETSAPAETNVKYQIVDQEYSNLVVPNDGYNRVAPYEDQVNGASYIQSKTAKKTQKPGHKMNVQKTVVDGNGNTVPQDNIAPITDDEILPEYESGADN